ncbi:MAG: radical SAM protein, partial [Cytophagales bacterium]|nr:radical SAM protein [Cytophagales bacterium]
AEYRIFQRDQLRIGDQSMPYADVLSHLVNKKNVARGGEGDNWYHITEVPNLAALFLCSYLMERGITADFISYLPGELNYLEQLLQTDQVTAVAITTTFYVSSFPITDICGKVRQINPDVPIIVGGPYINNIVNDMTPVQLAFTLEEIGADIYVVEDQGEATLAALLKALKKGTDVSAVPNCFTRRGGKYTFSGKEKENNNLNEMVVNWDHFSDYQIGPTVQMRTARSCAFKCSFCDYPIRAGALSTADLCAVEKELFQLHRRGVKNIVFIDDTFNIPAKRFQELCKMMIRNNFGFSWFSYFRCGNVRSKETYDLMKESGCAGVFLGIESADDGVLVNMNKGTDVKQYLYGIEQLNLRGIPSFASFIAGFPGETDRSIENNIRFLNSAAPTFYRAEPFWYNQRAPIHHSAAQFELEGDGYRWKHKTMDVTQACDGVDRMFSDVRHSVWMPMYMFDFWALPYLLGKGVKLPEIIDFMKFGESAIASRHDAGVFGQSIGKLEKLCGSMDIQPAKYKQGVLINN